MPGPATSSLESSILQDKEPAKRGGQEAMDRRCNSLNQVTECNRRLVPILRDLLDSDDPTMVVYTANALARLKIGASAAISSVGRISDIHRGRSTAGGGRRSRAAKKRPKSVPKLA